MNRVNFSEPPARMNPRQHELLQQADAFYVERPEIDQRCHQEFLKPGALIRIKAPRLMGKTSLMTKILDQATQQGYTTISLNVQLTNTQLFADLTQFLQEFCTRIALQLELPERFTEYWNPILGSKTACTFYFERYLLATTTNPLVLALDEVDVMFNYPKLAADFFGLLRAWHEEAKNREIWQKLRLILIHSTEVFVPMSVNQSPFNVGLPIELSEFQPAMVLELAQRYGLSWSTTEVEQLMAMVGGHPYLVRKAIESIARFEITLKQLLETAPTNHGLYGNHLRQQLWDLQQHRELAMALKKAVDTPYPVRLTPMQGFKLHSMGLVLLQGNQVTPRCNLYRYYFRLKL
ncbi:MULTISPECIES: AAA-like domain-containing protein [unclassified Coleofasciculus]|uniref:AAA-like domain-containing protein n=1 Tax=unclassified Coleofasciculus TaxID=2692782 RepID=UPI0018801A17|nr:MULTISPECIES: AAA-like domain-containing protein [unclassified Coleofasciculus]MBE9125195.1 AAA-like domain-containing protein [Coleofasciculus sp. LEGE 07081]MBE9148772.1 AAA-like domain-containing protein [Coleofasciculus sp. LEGE 07092]